MKRLIPFIASTAMIASLVTGCVKDGPQTPPATTSQEAPASAEAAPESAPATDAATTTPDATTQASEKESSDPAKLAEGLSDKGYWIFAVLSDVTLDKDLTVSGTFHDKGDASAKVYRKLALYAQDADHKVTATYTLTVPQMVVESPNFRIQEGTVKGNVLVKAEGFELKNSKIDGNLTFETQAQKDSAVLTEGTVTGEVTVANQ